MNTDFNTVFSGQLPKEISDSGGGFTEPAPALPARSYPDFRGDQAAEILWLQSQLVQVQRTLLFQTERLRVRADLWEAKIELDQLHAQESGRCRVRVNELEVALAKALALLEPIRGNVDSVALNRVKMTLGATVKKQAAEPCVPAVVLSVAPSGVRSGLLRCVACDCDLRVESVGPEETRESFLRRKQAVWDGHLVFMNQPKLSAEEHNAKPAGRWGASAPATAPGGGAMEGKAC